MPKFVVQILDRDGNGPVESAFDCENAEAAIERARGDLAELAGHGLPRPPLNMLTVEVFDEVRRPIREIRLILEEIDKSMPPSQNQAPTGSRPSRTTAAQRNAAWQNTERFVKEMAEDEQKRRLEKTERLRKARLDSKE